MKVGITQRIYVEPYNGFTYNTLQTAWYSFLTDHTIIPIPNDLNYPLIEDIDVLILGGGQRHPIRDIIENKLIEKYKGVIPIIGICHGLRVLTEYFGGTIKDIENHQGTEHLIKYDDKYYTVNSFHKTAIDKLPNRFSHVKTLATTVEEDPTVESWYNEKLRIGGTMWHPERGCIIPKEIGTWLNK